MIELVEERVVTMVIHQMTTQLRAAFLVGKQWGREEDTQNMRGLAGAMREWTAVRPHQTRPVLVEEVWGAVLAGGPISTWQLMRLREVLG